MYAAIIGLGTTFFAYNFSGIVGKALKKLWDSSTVFERVVFVLCLVILRSYCTVAEESERIHGEQCIDFEIKDD